MPPNTLNDVTVEGDPLRSPLHTTVRCGGDNAPSLSPVLKVLLICYSPSTAIRSPQCWPQGHRRSYLNYGRVHPRGARLTSTRTNTTNTTTFTSHDVHLDTKVLNMEQGSLWKTSRSPLILKPAKQESEWRTFSPVFDISRSTSLAFRRLDRAMRHRLRARPPTFLYRWPHKVPDLLLEARSIVLRGHSLPSLPSGPSLSFLFTVTSFGFYALTMSLRPSMPSSTQGPEVSKTLFAAKTFAEESKPITRSEI